MRTRVFLAGSLFLLMGAAALLSSGSDVLADERVLMTAIDIGDGEENSKSEGEAKAKAQVKGSDKKGKYYYKKTCKSCHAKDGEGGEITPISKTIKQWERFFKKDVHQGDEPVSGTFDETQLIHIKTFLLNHAADSDQPETCG